MRGMRIPINTTVFRIPTQRTQKEKRKKQCFTVNHFPPRATFDRASGNLNEPPIVRSSLTREDTVLPDSSQKSSSSSKPLFPDARLPMAYPPPDFEFARLLWLLKPGVTILRSGFMLRLPCVKMLGSSGCTSFNLPTDFLRLRVIRDIMATWGKEVVLVGWFNKKLGNLQLDLQLKNQIT